MSDNPNSMFWPNLGLKVGSLVIYHPIDYAKVLIQIGYEPMKPYPTKTIFGKPALALPNMFKYVSYIKTIDGVSGCFRGLSPKLCGFVLDFVVCSKTTAYLGGDKYSEEDTENLSEQERIQRLSNKLSVDITARTAAIIASQPFTVVTLRMMAQFVGGEDKYSGIFSSITEIYRENGISGFFSGLIPRLLAEILSLFLITSLDYWIKHHIIVDPSKHSLVTSLVSFFASSVTQPFQVVSTCMAVVDSGLAAGKPPHMPLYTSWTDCWCHLSKTKQLKRGSSILFRYYTGPYSVSPSASQYVQKIE